MYITISRADVQPMPRLLGRLPRHSKQYAIIRGGEKTKDDRLLDSLEPVDLIAYCNIGRSRYSHLTMYLGDNKIACHSCCRSDNRAYTWDNYCGLERSLT
jgi:hypothetical protein